MAVASRPRAIGVFRVKKKLQALLTELERADAIRDDVRDKILALLSAHYGAVVVDFEI